MKQTSAALVIWGMTMLPVAILSTGVATQGCKAALPVIRAALTASEIACVFTSPLTDAGKVAELCAIDKAIVPLLMPEIERMIATREAAAKAGVTWYSVKVDAGADGGKDRGF